MSIGFDKVELEYLPNSLEYAWNLVHHETDLASQLIKEIKSSLPEIIDQKEYQCFEACSWVIEGRVAFQEDDYRYGLEVLQKAVDVLVEGENLKWLGRAYGLIGVIYRQLGDRPLAVDNLHRRLDIGAKLNDPLMQCASLNSLGLIYADSGEHNLAIEHFLKGLPFSRQCGDVFRLTFCLSNLADSLISIGRAKDAKPYLEEAITVCESPEYGFPRCIPIQQMARAECALGNFEKSLTLYEEAGKLNTEFGNDYTQVKIHVGLGELYGAWNRPKDAIKEYLIALIICQESGFRSLALPAHENLAKIYAEIGDYEQAVYHHQKLNQEKTIFFHEEAQKQVHKLQVKFETERVKRESELLQAQNKTLEESVEKRTQELRENRDRLAQLNEQKNAFIAVLTHDMKTPLTSIAISVDLLRRKPEILTNNPDILNRLDRSQKRILRLVENIIDLDKLESGDPIKLKKSEVDLSAILNNMVSEQTEHAQKKEIELNCLNPDSPIILLGDRFQLERIFTNLISNAIKYTQKGGKITISSNQEDELAIIFIKDTGHGIPLEHQSNIFERYYRIDKHQEFAQGAGLGLPIVRALVEAHGGTISVDSVVDQGTVFTLKLPTNY